MSKVKIYSLQKLQKQLKTEKDLTRREQLRQVLDEMAEVYPDESEIPSNPREIFTTPTKSLDKCDCLIDRFIYGTKTK